MRPNLTNRVSVIVKAEVTKLKLQVKSVTNDLSPWASQLTGNQYNINNIISIGM